MAGDPAHDLRRAVSAYVASLCACIEAATDVHAVEALLQQAKAMLLLGGPAEASSARSAEAAEASRPAAVATANGQSHGRDVIRAAAGNDEEQERLAEQTKSLRLCAARLGQPGDIQAALWGAPFATLAAVLLSGAQRTYCIH